MSKTMMTSQIEQQIEALPPVEQLMMLERIVHHLKQLLVQPNLGISGTNRHGVTRKLNSIYTMNSSRLDSQVTNAQFSSIGRDEWL
jgi:hypothetical protein